MARSSHARPSVPRNAGGSPGRSDAHDSGGAFVPPAGLASGRTLDAEAIGLFERAMASLQRHEYRAALAQFEELQERFPSEGALLDRARLYAARCRRELAPPADGGTGTIDDRLAAATAALNNDDDRTAAELLASVLDDAPRHDHGQYLLAVVHARRGAVVAAIDALRLAIAASPEIRVQAKHDADFDPLRGDREFEALMAVPPAHSDTGRET